MRLSYNFLTFKANNELVNNPIRYQYFAADSIASVIVVLEKILLLLAVGRAVQ